MVRRKGDMNMQIGCPRQGKHFVITEMTVFPWLSLLL